MRTEKDFEIYMNEIRKYAAEEGYETLDETFAEHLRCRYFGLDVVIAEGERIFLREMKMSDLEAIYDMESGEEVLRDFIKESREESERYLKSYIETMYPMYDYGIWTIVEAGTGEVLGFCGLGRPEGASFAKCDGEVSGTDIGYFIRPERRRSGFALEAVEIAMDYAKNYVELSEIYARIDRGNIASQRLIERAGFVRICKNNQGFIYKKEL